MIPIIGLGESFIEAYIRALIQASINDSFENAKQSHCQCESQCDLAITKFLDSVEPLEFLRVLVQSRTGVVT